MTTIAEQAVKERRQRILVSMEIPRTIQSLADQEGVSYHTIRSDIKDLIADDYVRIASQVSDTGKRMFVSGGKRPMPEYALPTGKASAQRLAINLGRKPSVLSLSIADKIQNVRYINLLLLNHVATDSVLSPKEINLWRKGLNEARETIHNYCIIVDQMLRNDSLWNPDRLLAIKDDEEFDANAILNAHAEYLTYLEEVSNEQRDAAQRNGTGDSSADST